MTSLTKQPAPSEGAFIHPNAICESSAIGAGTRIWAFAHVLPQARIGRDCNICDGVFVENDVVLGDRVTVKCGVQLWDGVTLEDDTFVGPNATFTNTMYPRSREYQSNFLRTVVRNKASIGANATILPGLTIGANAMVGAGAVVTQSVPANAIVFGNPARIVGYVDTLEKVSASGLSDTDEDPGLAPVKVEVTGVELRKRNSISTMVFEGDIPFIPNGCEITSNATAEKDGMPQARRNAQQYLICLKGSCVVLVDDGVKRCEVLMDRPNIGLHIPAMTWSGAYKFSSDMVLISFTSADASTPILDYGQFQLEIGR